MAETKTLVDRLGYIAQDAAPNEAETIIETMNRIETLEAALREPDRVSRIIRNVAEWTPEMRKALVKEMQRRWPETATAPDEAGAQTQEAPPARED
jgi:hypothetical protein